MKKISKKIVSLVTLAAFALTLVPAAAFAAGTASANASAILIDGQSEVTVDAKDTEQVNFVVKAADGSIADTNLQNVKVWAEDEDGYLTDAVTFGGNDNLKVTGKNSKIMKFGDEATFEVGTDATFTATFERGGVYTIKAGVGDVASNANKAENAVASDFQYLGGDIKVTVNDPTVVTDYIVLKDQIKNVLEFDETNTAKLDLTDAKIRDGFKFNGSDVYTLSGVAYDENKQPVANKTFTLSTSKGDVVEFGADNVTTTEVTTNYKGEFTVPFSMQDQKNATITIANEEDGINYTVRILAATTSAQNINRTLEDGYVLAGKDANWTDANRMFTDAVQFEILDEKGDAVTGELQGEPATTSDDADHQNCVRILGKPEKSTMDANDIVLAWDEDHGVYTLKYNGAYADRVKDLVEGQYTVRVSLANDDNATVTFNVAKYAGAEELVLDMTAVDKSSNRTTSISDEVTLGQKVTVTAKFVDKNGIKIPATNVEFGATGKAVLDNATKQDGTTLTFATRDDIVANEPLLGTVITVSAFNNKTGLVQQDLTVVDSYNSFSLEFDPTQGPINEDNKVTVNVVKEDGSKAQVSGKIVGAVVDDQSNADAKVSVDVVNDVKNGKGTISLYSDKETTANVIVVVKDNTNSGMYVGNLEYTFGKEDPLADRTVVMTIGSTDYVVNNNIITGDAAPYVDSNWRTMVPVRALAESFDAEVIYENNVITINYDGGTQIVMNVGEKTYTVNGVEAEMDTEPVIGEGDRTFVPIRFAAEAMGFSVTPLQDANGLTASVVFQR